MGWGCAGGHGECHGARGTGGRGRELGRGRAVSGGRRRLSSTSTTCTGHGRGKDDVWEVAGTVVSNWEEGEDEGRAEATGTGGVLCGVRARHGVHRRNGRGCDRGVQG